MIRQYECKLCSDSFDEKALLDSHIDIREDFEELKQLRETLFQLRLNFCKKQKTAPWSMKNFDAAIEELKKNKSRYPNGWKNELFMKEVAENNLKISMLESINRIKSENYYPDFMRKADVTTTYKGKGVFVVSVSINETNLQRHL